MRISNDYLRRYENAMMKYEKLSPHPRRRLTNHARLEQQYHNFHGHSSSEECLTRSKSKSTSSIDTQSVNNILDEFEDLNYRRSSDLSDIDVDCIGVNNYEEIMDWQKRQVTEKQNSRMLRTQNHTASREHHHPASPTKVSRQTQVQQRSRDRRVEKSSEKKFLSPPDESSRNERKNFISPFQNRERNDEVRASIRSAKTPPEVLLRKGEVQKRVDEWLNQTRSQNCAGFIKESKGLTRSNSSAEQKSYRRLRQQELRSRRCQLNVSSSYDDLSHEGLKLACKKTTENPKVSVGVNTSRGTYKQYLALKNKARLQKQQESANQENVKTSVVYRSREASPSTRTHHYVRGDVVNLSFRSSPSKRHELGEQGQQPQQLQHQYQWTGEAAPPINARVKTARARHQMENRISSLVKARNEMSTTSAVTSGTPAAAVNRRASFKCETARSSSQPTSTNASPSKGSEESVPALVSRANQDQVLGALPTARSSEQDSGIKIVESNPPTESSSDLSQEHYGSVSARVRAFQGKSEHRMPKSRSLQGSNILIETRNKSPMSPTRNDDVFQFKEVDRNQSTFKPNVTSLNQHNEQSSTKKDREMEPATRYVEKIYETALQPEVIHADNLEAVLRPERTNFVYGERISKDMSSIARKDDDSGKRKTVSNYNNNPESKPQETGLNHCLKLLQRSPSFRLKRSHPVQREKEIYTKLPSNEQTIANDQPMPTNSFKSFQTAILPTPTLQTTKSENPQTTRAVDQVNSAREKLDSNSYESRSTLKLNIPIASNDTIENDNNIRKDSSTNRQVPLGTQGITNPNDDLKNETTSSFNNVGIPDQAHTATREKTEDGTVIKEILVKTLQFKQDLPSSTPPAPPPRTCLESTRKQESAIIVELTPLRNKQPLNYNSVLNDDYSNLHSRGHQQQKQEEKIYVTKEEMERKKLMDLLRKGEFELAKLVSLSNT